MARIELKQPGQAVADFSVNGHLITVAGVQVDCRDLQKDSEQIIEVRQSEHGAQMNGDGAYLAHIAIPAKVFVEVEGKEGSEFELVAQDLDPDAVTVTLWPLAS